MLNNPVFENNDQIKFYGLKNRLAAVMGIFLSIFFIYFFIMDLSYSRFLNVFSPLSYFHPIRNLVSHRLIFILFGIFSAFIIIRISFFPNVVISEKQIKIGWRIGGKFGLSYRHHIPWDRIAQVDSGGSRMIQWSPNTLIIYHTGKVPVGRSSDLEEAVISTGLGFKNYCKILNLVIKRAPKAKIDQLTLNLIKQCPEIGTGIQKIGSGH
ncbi:MAG: hypothetical protein ACHQYP_02800 [Nitrospiria bacterium]